MSTRNSVDHVTAQRFLDEFCRAVQEVAPNAGLVGRDIIEYCAYHEDLPDGAKRRISSLVGQRMGMSGTWAGKRYRNVLRGLLYPDRLGGADKKWICWYVSEHPDWSVQQLHEGVNVHLEGKKIFPNTVYSYVYQTWQKLHRQQKEQRRREPAQDPKLEKTEEPIQATANETKRESQESQNYSDLFDDVLPYCE